MTDDTDDSSETTDLVTDPNSSEEVNPDDSDATDQTENPDVNSGNPLIPDPVDSN